ncbi:unnamed protein product, partial [Mesorhabditis belari]|uniref:26S proteasome non-ATPase regulatory subunit 8 n=1 Tax=Mesorhabditis belari TaxID=2138241 RepID=A0AAF3J6V4_9BILA
MSLQALHKDLLKKWSEKEPKIDQLEAALQAIKKVLSETDSESAEALTTITRDVLEIDALVAAIKGDLQAFSVSISSVMSFYSTLRHDSAQLYLLQGLNLMYLLVSNRLSDFHVFLEQIDQSIQTNNPYISTPVKLEQWLMEGAYNKIVLTEKNIPSPYYTSFIRIMMDTVRGEIALNLERSFKRLPVRDAQQLLLLDDQPRLTQFANERKWKLEGSAYVFDNEEKMETNEAPKSSLDTQRIARQTIYYAKQLEMIV